MRWLGRTPTEHCGRRRIADGEPRVGQQFDGHSAQGRRRQHDQALDGRAISARRQSFAKRVIALLLDFPNLSSHLGKSLSRRASRRSGQQRGQIGAQEVVVRSLITACRDEINPMRLACVTHDDGPGFERTELCGSSRATQSGKGDATACLLEAFGRRSPPRGGGVVTTLIDKVLSQNRRTVRRIGMSRSPSGSMQLLGPS